MLILCWSSATCIATLIRREAVWQVFSSASRLAFTVRPSAPASEGHRTGDSSPVSGKTRIYTTGSCWQMSLLLGVPSLLCTQLRFAPCRQATLPSPAVNPFTSQASQPFVLSAMCKHGALQATTAVIVEIALLWMMAQDTGEAATALLVRLAHSSWRIR